MMGPGAQESFAQLLAWQKEGKEPEATGLDDFPLHAEDPLAPYHRRINAYYAAVSKIQYYWEAKPAKLPAGKAILELDQREKGQLFRALIVRLLFWNMAETERLRLRRAAGVSEAQALIETFQNCVRNLSDLLTQNSQDFRLDPNYLNALIGELLKSPLEFTSGDLVTMLDLISNGGWIPKVLRSRYIALSPEAVVRAVEIFNGKSGLTPPLMEQLTKWKEAIEGTHRISSDDRKLLLRLKALVGHDAEIEIARGEAWSNAALEDLKSMPAKLRSEWASLLRHCQKAETSKPTKKWSKAANEYVEELGRPEFKLRLLRWFELVALPRPIHEENSDPQWHPEPDLLIADGNSVILKGLVWSCAGWKDKEVSRAISRLAEVCFKKVRNLGARCPRVGNACLFSLSDTVTDDAAAELTRLDQIVKGNSVKKLIGKSLDKAADLSGQTREDLEELTVPSYGLDAEGWLRQTFGQFTAEFRIHGLDSMELRWRKTDGKPQKSVPAEVKLSHNAEFAKFKQTLKDIEKMLPAQRQRIERLLMSERTWTMDKWRDRYLNHPLLSHLTRRLIWHFNDGDRAVLGAWLDGRLVDVADKPLDGLGPETQVRLWHPIGCAVDTVIAWRRWLETHQIMQPIKQAHREVYVLTDAEMQTDTYSNRFAAHIIGQHQFAALLRQRGWKYSFMGGFDSYNTPTIELPEWGLRVEFWVEATEELADSGVSRYVATDQVRFLRGAQLLPLSEVPALVFTEMMRDVDLFVGVCSIGNDPAWQDSGETGRFGQYWNEYSFGELSATAATRRDVISRLLPKLKIAGQCTLTDKFLVVRGTLRTYKIHLKSGNILMEPNDGYLCIVPGRGTASSKSDAVFLPFEGDSMLSIILSKAFLLAEDDQIKDVTILNQIRMK
jgi:hypothetical protein